MTTLLVANRGEIALRIFRTARSMGMRCAAVFSEADAAAPHVRSADDSRCIGPPPAADSYLRAEAIIEAARAMGADLVHPGYGFLSEDAGFAQACADAGLSFVGPPAGVLRAVGDKAAARAIAERAGVPLLPGASLSGGDVAAAAERVGYPVIVKPAAGGGGKGMAVVHDPADLEAAVEAARRIGLSAFGDDHVMLERFLASARHIEVQVLADTHGRVVHLGERDCSVQRRHQKVIEEAPAPGLDPALRDTLCEAAVAFAREAGYVNAGTCEFLVGDDGSSGFIECNARLQVEHPVTEAVTGVDLVEQQLRVALGQPLSVEATEPGGHAIEARIYAEDPRDGFLPRTGTLVHVRWPAVRVDAGVASGSEVTPHYDPLLAKLTVHGPDRPGAVRALVDALGEVELLGVTTNTSYLRGVASDPAFASGGVTTRWLEQRPPDPAPDVDAAAAVAAASEAASTPATADPWDALGGWRLGGRRVIVTLHGLEGERTLVVGGHRVGRHDVRPGDEPGVWWVDGRRAVAVADGPTRLVALDQESFAFTLGPAPRVLEPTGRAGLGAPLPGRVIAVHVSGGDAVAAGAPLVVVEAMKMEHTVSAPADGRVGALRCAVGDQVDRGQVLLDFEPGG